MTLREEVRSGCEQKLDDMAEKVVEQANMFTVGSSLNPLDLVKLASGGRADTLRKKLVSQLIADAEEALVKVWNDQLELLEKNPAEAL